MNYYKPVISDLLIGDQLEISNAILKAYYHL